MFSKIRNVLSGSGSSSDSSSKGSSPPMSRGSQSPKFPYTRPHFLYLSEDQVQASADHRTRPIITPNRAMPFSTGYAECINAGKSKWNEDQAVSHQAVLKSGNFVMPYQMYGLFDGHAGVGASICAANQMHHVVHERLVDAQDDIWSDFIDYEEPHNRNLLISGALEAAFKEMDDIIKDDRATLQSSGGCTAMVAVFLLNQLYVANAGDSRSIVCKGCGYELLSTDFTPESDRSRIRQLAQAKPHLLGNEFTFMEYIRQPRHSDLGKRILYRDAYMTGWAHKTIAIEDIKTPIINGQGKRSRVMRTIGVTRGFGDHELVSVHQKVPIKPFLTCHPEVKVYDLTNCGKDEVLVMGTDGLWDVIDGHMVTQIINYAMDKFSHKVCPTAAACLVGAARGTCRDHSWVMKTEKVASVDDISVFVIPLYPSSQTSYKLRDDSISLDEGEHYFEVVEERRAASRSVASSAESLPSISVSGISIPERNKSEIVLPDYEEEYSESEVEEAPVEKVKHKKTAVKKTQTRHDKQTSTEVHSPKYKEPARSPPVSPKYKEPARSPPVSPKYKEPAPDRSPPVYPKYREPKTSRSPPKYKQATVRPPPLSPHHVEPLTIRSTPTSPKYKEPAHSLPASPKYKEPAPFPAPKKSQKESKHRPKESKARPLTADAWENIDKLYLASQQPAEIYVESEIGDASSDHGPALPGFFPATPRPPPPAVVSSSDSITSDEFVDPRTEIKSRRLRKCFSSSDISTDEDLRAIHKRHAKKAAAKARKIQKAQIAQREAKLAARRSPPPKAKPVEQPKVTEPVEPGPPQLAPVLTSGRVKQLEMFNESFASGDVPQILQQRHGSEPRERTVISPTIRNPPQKPEKELQACSLPPAELARRLVQRIKQAETGHGSKKRSPKRDAVASTSKRVQSKSPTPSPSKSPTKSLVPSTSMSPPLLPPTSPPRSPKHRVKRTTPKPKAQEPKWEFYEDNEYSGKK